MRLKIACISMITAVIACVSVAAAATPLFVLDSELPDDARIFRVDPATGALTPVGTIAPDAGEALGLAAASDNLLYVSTHTGNILEVTVEPYSYTVLGNVGGYLVGLAYSHGQLYATDQNADELSRIELAPLAKHVVDRVHLGSPSGPDLDLDGGDIAESADGAWYLWNNIEQDLYLLDVTTAVAMQIDPDTSGLGSRTGLAFDYDGGGALIGASNPLNALITIDVATGTTLGSVDFCLDCPNQYEYRYGDLASLHCEDDDGDGFAANASGCGPADCDDGDAAVHPGALERCNGRDDDCDGGADDGADALCDDHDQCNGSEQCVAGACAAGGAPDCDDHNPCTTDGCSAAGGCTHGFNTDPCDDGNACTHTDRCEAGQCAGDDRVTCVALDQCHVAGTCNPATGQCSHPAADAGAPCNDRDLCTLTDRCDGTGACVGSNPVVCASTGDCHGVGTCNPDTGFCSDPPVEDGGLCEDGNACTFDDICLAGQCSGVPATCGDGKLQANCAEECDDGNRVDRDGCSADCKFEGCHPAPMTGCRGGDGKLRDIMLFKGALASKNLLYWTWNRTGITPRSHFGTPLTSTDYRLCMYDGASKLVLSAAAPGGGLCGPGTACWKTRPSGYRYYDKLLTPDGIQEIILADGTVERGITKISLRALGTNLALPNQTSIRLPVRAQLMNADGRCWEVTYSKAIQNDGKWFKAKGD